MTQPGTLLEVVAWLWLSGRCVPKASAQMVVVNPLREAPVYAPAPVRVWRDPATGQVHVWHDKALPGFTRRVRVNLGQSWEVMEGVQLTDGRIWINGRVTDVPPGN